MIFLKLYKFFLIIIFSFAVGIIPVHAAANLRDIVSQPILYSQTDAVNVNYDDLNMWNQIDFTKFQNLRYLSFNNVYLDSSKDVFLQRHIDNLYFSNSVIDLNHFHLDEYKTVSIANTYDLSIDEQLVKQYSLTGFLNPEYQKDDTYDSYFDRVVKTIYEEGMTDEEKIEAVTLFVLKNMNYDYDKKYSDLSMSESIVKHHLGVADHYSYFEEQLLNKIGIFALAVNGYVDKSNPNNSTHTWIVVFLNNRWYFIDPTWLDSDSIETSQKLMQSPYYMVPVDEITEFSFDHFFDFSVYNLIPLEERVSHMSILDRLSSIKSLKLDNSTKIKTENSYLPIIFGVSIFVISLIIFSFLFFRKQSKK